MKSSIFSLLVFGSLRFARASNAQQARRIFARSINADRKESDRPIRVSIEQVRYVGAITPAQLGAVGYDQEVKRMPHRFRDETEGESYMNQKGFEIDTIRNNAEGIIDSLFASLD